MDLDIERNKHFRIRVTDLNTDSFIESQSVEANLQFAILEKLEEIRMQGVDIENAVERN